MDKSKLPHFLWPTLYTANTNTKQPMVRLIRKTLKVENRLYTMCLNKKQAHYVDE